MLYLATASSPKVRDLMTAGLLGCVENPGGGSRGVPGAWWCGENGRFGSGWPGDEAWLAWLEGARDRASTCLFIAAPDVVGDAAATLAESAPWLPRIRALGFPAALVAQDGLEDLEVPWDTFDALFLGGSTDWKIGPGAHALAAEAKRRGKWLHMGRVNGRRRWLIADLMGCDSCDGTLLAFGPDRNLPYLLSFTSTLEA